MGKRNSIFLVLMTVLILSSIANARVANLTDSFFDLDGNINATVINSTAFYESGVRVCLADGTNCQSVGSSQWNITSSVYLINNSNILDVDSNVLNSTIDTRITLFDFINGLWDNSTGETKLIYPQNIDIQSQNLTNINELIAPDGSAIKFGDSGVFTNIDQALNLQTNQTVSDGSVTHILTDLQGKKVIEAWQSGKNNSWGFHRNSYGIFGDLGLTNGSKLTDAIYMWEAIGINPSFDYDTAGQGASLGVQYGVETQKLILHDDLGAGQLEGSGEFRWDGRDGTNFHILNIPMHLSIARQENITFGTGLADLFLIDWTGETTGQQPPPPFVESGDGLGNSLQEWSTRNDARCDSNPCARAKGGSAGVIRGMDYNFATTNTSLMFLNFFYGSDNMDAGSSDNFTVKMNNNVGSGWVTIWSDSATSADINPPIEKTFSLPSSMDDKSNVTLRFEHTATSTIEESFVDTIKVNGTLGSPTTIEVTQLDAEIKFGNATMFWNASSQKLTFANSSQTDTLFPLNTTGASSSQNLWDTIVSDSGSTSANSPTDTLNLVGNNKLLTSIVGDTVTFDFNDTLNNLTILDISSNLYDQSLNTTDNVKFDNLELSSTLPKITLTDSDSVGPSYGDIWLSNGITFFRTDQGNSIGGSGFTWMVDGSATMRLDENGALHTSNIIGYATNDNLSLVASGTGRIIFKPAGVEMVSIENNGTMFTQEIVSNENITAKFFKGDGSLLTNINVPETYNPWTNDSTTVLLKTDAPQTINISDLNLLKSSKPTLTLQETGQEKYTIDGGTSALSFKLNGALKGYLSQSGYWVFGNSATPHIANGQGDIIIRDALDVGGNAYIGGGITSTDWTNVSIVESQISDLTHTIDTDTQKTTNNFYLYNDSTTIYFNDTQNNITIQDIINNSDINISHLTPKGVKGEIIWNDGTEWKLLSPAGLGGYQLYSNSNVISWTPIAISVDSFQTWSPDFRNDVVADSATDTVILTSPDGSINITGISISDKMQFQLNETISKNVIFTENLTSDMLFGQIITPLAASGVNCNTVCDGMDGQLYGSENWICQGAQTISGTPALTACSSTTGNRNCFCKN